MKGDLTIHYFEGKELKCIARHGITVERAQELVIPWLRQGKSVQMTWENQDKYNVLAKAEKSNA